MFGYRTPVKDVTPKESNKSPKAIDPIVRTERAGPSVEVDGRSTKVRRSIGEIEARASATPPTQHKTLSQPEGRAKAKAALAVPESKTGTQKGKTTSSTTDTERSPKQTVKYKNKTSEAKACLVKAKQYLGQSGNLKTEIKTKVNEALERLYILVRELEEERDREPLVTKEKAKKGQCQEQEENQEGQKEAQGSEILKHLAEHSKKLNENQVEMEKLSEMLRKQQELLESRGTYASIAAAAPLRKIAGPAAMHSIVITSKNEKETGEQVFEKIRNVVNAKEEGVRIDKIRKAKDRKIIVGCRNQDELKRVRDRIRETGDLLNVEEVKNKDPLIILYSVLKNNTDDDIVKALWNQNRHLLGEASGEDHIEIRFRRKARNHLTSHVVARVSPRIWQCLTNAGAVHIDMQRVRVADQSPLIQCSRCLGYGHGKRFCHEAVDVCSHCGGQHLKMDCADWLVNAPASCINCSKAKIGTAEHNAFSDECPIRQKWDALARSSVAYC